MGQGHKHTLTAWGIIITLGIVYGDIGTSPLYVMRAIIGDNPITPELVYGGISCIFWTLTIQASFKYIYHALSADNNGEGGIFALYGLVRRVSPKWMIYVAMVGCSALLADGIITPAISLTSAVEGLKKLNEGVPVEAIVIIILTGLFGMQQFGTDFLGKVFGPVMAIWFSMLAILGLSQIIGDLSIVQALLPTNAISLILHYPKALILISAVFLCVTGAEAMYSDLGHCGKENIRASWIFVKIALIINYLGQGAWLIKMSATGELLGERNPFYEIMPSWFLYPGIAISTVATIIASQALITGSFSLINEAVKLKVWYRLLIIYPTEHRSQFYIPMINWMLYFGCLGIVLYFKESSKMEAAYGLAITLAMLSTSILILFYWTRIKRKNIAAVIAMGTLFFTVEAAFTYANLLKLTHGAWVTLLLTGVFFLVMFVHYRASRIRRKAMTYKKLEHYKPIIEDLIADTSIPKFASNLVYMVNANRKDEIESSVIKSILEKQPKRAETYWFVNLHVTDEPNTQEYKVTNIIPHKLIRVDFFLGYRQHPSANVLLKQVINALNTSGEYVYKNSNETLEKYNIPADFKYITIEKVFAFEDTLNAVDKLTVTLYEWITPLSLNAAEGYDLTSEDLLVETFPIRVREQARYETLKRVN